MSDKERILFLRNELDEHNHSYYVLDTPLISDFEFDKLLAELKILEDNNPDLFDENSPSKKVGGMVIDRLNAVNHKYPMLSLANTYNAEELQDFDNKIKKWIEQLTDLSNISKNEPQIALICSICLWSIKKMVVF